MTITKTTIHRDPKLPYAVNLANTINEYWGRQVCMPDGSDNKYTGNVYSHSRYGIPENAPRFHHAIVRVRKVGRSLFIVR